MDQVRGMDRSSKSRTKIVSLPNGAQVVYHKESRIQIHFKMNLQWWERTLSITLELFQAAAKKAERRKRSEDPSLKLPRDL